VLEVAPVRINYTYMFCVANVQEKLPKMDGAIHLTNCSSCVFNSRLRALGIYFNRVPVVRLRKTTVCDSLYNYKFSPFCSRVFTVTFLFRVFFLFTFLFSICYAVFHMCCVLVA
jgi:hypothetical protein